MSGEDNKKSFWSTIPGILTGIAAVLTAIGGLIVAYQTLVPPAETNQMPTIEAIEFNPISPSAMGEPILVTVRANDSDNDKINYRFMIKGPTDQEYRRQADWSTDNKWKWIPTVDDVGNNGIRVYVRDGKHPDEEGNYIDRNFKITKDASALTSDALVLYSQGKYDDAIKAYDEAIKLDPKNKEAFFNRGLALAALDKFDEAIKDYDKATKLDPKNKEAFYNMGLALAALARYDEAIQDYDEAIKLDPNYKEAFFNRGLALAVLEKFDEAIQDYDEAIKLDPNYKEAFFNRGLALAALDKFDEAIKDYDEAIKLDPKNKEAFYNKGLALVALGKCSEAIKAYDEAVTLDPNYNDAIVARESAERGGSIRVKCEGGYVAKFTLAYKLEGAVSEKESGDITIGKSKTIPIPPCATDISLTVEEHTGFSWKTIFTKNYNEPVTKCFRVTGTTFSPSYKGC